MRDMTLGEIHSPDITTACNSFIMINVHIFWEGLAGVGFNGVFKAHQKYGPFGATVRHKV